MDAAHPLGVEPWGNFLFKGGPNIRDAGLGALGVLGDDLLLQLLEAVTAADLCRLAAASKALYCFSNHDDLWRSRTLEEVEGAFRWCGTWRLTYLMTRGLVPAVDATTAGAPDVVASQGQRTGASAKRRKTSKTAAQATVAAGGRGTTAAGVVARAAALRVTGFYSDLLYQPWFCAHVDIAPEWLEVDNIDRRSGLSVEEFRRQYELPNVPVVLTDAVTRWRALGTWDRPLLRRAFAGRKVVAGNYPMDFDTYLAYCDSQRDDMPLYLFDSDFCAKAPQLAADFSVPPHFAEDLFAVLGPSRPDHRWLIMGPPRSGSSFHVDPNATSAWNGVISGSKKWILYPPHVIPPGVHPSADGADVATPVSLVEWFLNFYAATKEGKVKPIECVVRAGELIFVPSGWWHLALNLEESVAITQNYVSRANLPAVLKFLASKREDLVSGCSVDERSSLHDRFVDGLKAQRPAVYAEVAARQAAAAQRVEESKKLAALFKPAAAAAAQQAAGSADSCRRGAEPSAVQEAPAAAAAAFSFGFKLG